MAAMRSMRVRALHVSAMPPSGHPIEIQGVVHAIEILEREMPFLQFLCTYRVFCAVGAYIALELFGCFTFRAVGIFIVSSE